MNALLAWYFVAVWGTGYVATKLGLQYAPPFTFLTLRFSLGLLCLAPVVALWPPRWPRARPRPRPLRGGGSSEARGAGRGEPLRAVSRHVRRRHRARHLDAA